MSEVSNQPEDVVAVQQTTTVVSATWGLLPPPQMLKEYGEVVPDLPERLTSMFERQVSDRLQIERVESEAESKRANYRLAAGIVLSASIIIGGIVLVATGHDWAGVSMVGMNLVGWAGVFVYGVRSRDRHR